jgi:copper chaperone CopZ
VPTTTYGVLGMTCGHCVAAVTEEVRQLDGVSAVQVDLVPGGASRLSVTSVTSETAPDDEAVRGAVAEAGYELASRQ